MFRIAKPVASAVVLALWSTGAQAQGIWQSYTNEQIRQGAAICPANDPQSGSFFCFALSCAPDGPRQWTITYAGGAEPGGDVRATISVNGAPASPLPFTPVPRAGYVELTAPWDAERDGLLADQLVAGGTARLSLAAPNWQAGYDLPLDGAQGPLVEVLTTCPVPGPPPIADPIAETRAEAARFCQQMGGALQETDGLVSTPDINGDGRDDLVLNWGTLGCTSGGSPYCGSAGCVHGLFIALEGGGFKEVLETNVRGISARVMPVIELTLHGSACGGIGADRCVKYYTLDDALELDELD